MDVGAKLLHALCEGKDVYSFLRSKLTTGYFYGDEKEVYQFVAKHVSEYHQLPSVDTLLKEFPDVPESVEPVPYYMDKVEERYAFRTLNLGLTECSELMKEKKISETLELMGNMRNTIIQSSIRQQMAEFAQEGHDLLMAEYTKTQQVGEGIKFGWPYLDDLTSGLFAGDVVSFVGRPAVGKTYQLLYTAHNAWWKQCKNVLVVSMEMGVVPILQRLSAMHTNISITDIKKAMLSTFPVNKKEEYASKLVQLKGFPAQLWVIDGNLSSTPDQIFSMAVQLGVDLIVIDGAYLLQHENKRLDRYTKVAENAELIKRFTGQAQRPSICSYQFNRDAAKKKKTEEVGLEDIGYSDAIGQVSSVVLGIFQEESVETLKSRVIHVLKGREGETGRFRVMWDFQHMIFDQIMENVLLGVNGAPLQGPKLGYI